MASYSHSARISRRKWRPTVHCEGSKCWPACLTYETASPQEGRIRDERLNGLKSALARFHRCMVSTTVLRLLGTSNESLESLAQLGCRSRLLSWNSIGSFWRRPPATVSSSARPAAARPPPPTPVCGHIVAQSGGGRSIASLEDPIEVAVQSVAQTEVNLAVGFRYGNRPGISLRLDPEVILIGEMHNRATAEVALQLLRSRANSS